MKLICIAAAIIGSTAFTLPPANNGPSRHPIETVLQSTPGNDDASSAARKSQERKMEAASIAGADAIAKLDVEDRTKRAMLAEAVEDRIFELVDELEAVVKKHDGFLEGEVKEEAVELAKQTKALQNQYDDLVNGRPSSLLDVGGK